MKRPLTTALVFALGLLSFQCVAQKNFTLKSGTPIELQPTKTIYAREVKEGDLVKFKVVSDVKQGGNVIVSAGTIADGRVTQAKKSTIAGTKGRLSIDFKSLILEDGTQVPLNGNVRVSGKNRTPLAVATGVFVWPCIFITGTKAVLNETYSATATVMSNTEIRISK